MFLKPDNLLPIGYATYELFLAEAYITVSEKGFQWLHEKMILFKTVFGKYLKEYKEHKDQ